MPDIDIRMTDNSREIEREFESAVNAALHRMGLQAVRFAVDKISSYPAVDTGLLRNSITYAVSGQEAFTQSYRADTGTETGSYSGTAPNESDPNKKSVYIGTNVAYAQYVELSVRGKTGRPFIKPAASEHSDVYRRILEDELKG